MKKVQIDQAKIDACKTQPHLHGASEFPGAHAEVHDGVEHLVIGRAAALKKVSQHRQSRLRVAPPRILRQQRSIGLQRRLPPCI